MIICHISSMHDWNDDRIFQRNCVGLTKNNIIVKYIVTYEKDSDVKEGVSIIGLKKRSGIKRRLFSSLEAYKKGLRIKADVYHFHDPDLLPFMFIYLLKGKKVIFDIHENYLSRIDSAISNKFLKKLTMKFWRGFESLFVKKSKAGIVTTDTMKSLYSNTGADILTVSNLVYLETLKDLELEVSNKFDDYTVYVSGTHSSQRNCENIILAFRNVVDKFANSKLIFIGRYHPIDYKNKLQSIIDELSLHNNVLLEDMSPWKENFKRLSKGHIGLVFYEDNLNNRVTIPNRLFEYMYCGLAVIGDKYPEIIKVLEDTKCGLIADSDNINDISDKIIYLFENPDIIKKMSENGRKAVIEKYNYENTLVSLIEYYRRIANS